MPRPERRGGPDLDDEDYRQLAGFRLALRRYLRWAEERAGDVGLTAMQHQLMVAIRARGRGAEPSVGELAEELLLRHHSAVGLVDRAEAAGLVRRRADPSDHRVTRVGLTIEGDRQLRRLAQLHVEQLRQLGSQLRGLTEALAVDELGGQGREGGGDRGRREDGADGGPP